MEINQITEVYIEDLSTAGEGIGKIEGMVVFVPGTLPGDKVKIRISENKGRFMKAQCLEVIEPSADRCDSPCPNWQICGGCPLMGYSYEAQLRWKKKHVEDVISRIGGFDKSLVKDIISTGKILGYRNKGEFALQGNRFGYYSRKSHSLVEVEDCPIQGEGIMDVARNAVSGLRPGQKYFTRLTARVASTGENMAILENKDGDFKSDHRIMHDTIETAAGVLKTEVSPLSFYQVNPQCCNLLYSKVQEYADLKGDEKILDLYCGAGSIGLSMAARAERVIGVESVKPAVIDANRNAVINGIVNATFICGKAEDVIDTKLQGVKADLVIVDPPRGGCEKSLLEAILKINPLKIIYVSCDPSTLARDLKILCAEGSDYELKEASPVDMFPNTLHVETVVLMSRNS